MSLTNERRSETCVLTDLPQKRIICLTQCLLRARKELREVGEVESSRLRRYCLSSLHLLYLRKLPLCLAKQRDVLGLCRHTFSLRDLFFDLPKLRAKEHGLLRGLRAQRESILDGLAALAEELQLRALHIFFILEFAVQHLTVHDITYRRNAQSVH